ncbi:MAG: alanine--tRNA ligase, partial [Microbacteriaceae bacterium]|nr:alanine--tRNA ligase [Microbacteriaceae bacterium]
VTANLGEIAAIDDLRSLAISVRSRLGESATVVALGAQSSGKTSVIVATSQAARDRGVKASQLAKSASAMLGGGGGGKDDLAQAGGTDPQRIDQALQAIRKDLEAA